MKILIATCNRSAVGGIEKYLRCLIPALAKRGHEVAMLYQHSASPGSETVDRPDAETRVWYWDLLREDSGGWREIASWKPDVVYSHTLDSLDLENRLLDSYPCVLYIHVYWGTCISGRKCHTFPQMSPCERRLGPACLALYYPRGCGGLNPVTAWRNYQTHAQRAARLADYQKILVNSAHMFREYQRHGIGPEQLRLIHYPVTESNLEEIAYQPKAASGSILFVGRLTDLKGVDYLIRAVPAAERRLDRKLKLTIAGEGPERPRLERLARQLALAVDFTGWLESQEKIETIARADLLAVPSLWPEPFGLVGIEAGSLSVPAVGYASGGITDWLIPGETGELASGHLPTVEGLASAIVDALADPEHYSRLCRGAWEFSHQFTMEKHLSKLEPLLQQACGSASPKQDAVLQ